VISILRPGEEPLEIDYILVDFEGTLAADGRVHPKAKDKLNLLSKRVKIFVLTTGDKEKVRQVLRNVRAEVLDVREGDARRGKMAVLERLGPEKAAAVGNGVDDVSMFKEAALGIAVLTREGISSELIGEADLVFMNIVDALDFFLKPLRQKNLLGK
jgi:soluble P-type ATPase